ncbi:MAG: hypothetical protein JZU65_14705, partial [Chlorobium sp.]|nr:hypothetical protein [Chlorobium sp.]
GFVGDFADSGGLLFCHSGHYGCMVEDYSIAATLLRSDFRHRFTPKKSQVNSDDCVRNSNLL